MLAAVETTPTTPTAAKQTPIVPWSRRAKRASAPRLFAPPTATVGTDTSATTTRNVVTSHPIALNKSREVVAKMSTVRKARSAKTRNAKTSHLSPAKKTQTAKTQASPNA